MTTYINMTPHDINICDDDGNVVVTLKKSSSPARVKQENIFQYRDYGFSVFKSVFGEVENLPEPEPDTIFVVSGLVLDAVKGRRDLAAPGQLIRNDQGQPIGCLGLRMI